MNTLSRQAGLTIVEILVALVISTILMAGILAIFISNKQAFRLNSAYAEVHENARFLMNYLPNVIQLSGYRSTPLDTLFVPLDEVFPTATPHVQVSNNTGTNNSDVLTVRYQGSGDGAGNPDGTVRDCLNRPVDANIIAINVFSINASGDLICQATNPSAAPNVDTAILVNQLENMQVLLGEDLDNDRTTDRYVEPNFAGLNINRVRSVRVSLLLRSSDQLNKTQQATPFNLSGTTYTPAADFRLRKVLTFTVQLRNVLEAL